MRSIYIFALFFSFGAFARGYDVGEFRCGTTPNGQTTWILSNIDAIPGVPLARYVSLVPPPNTNLNVDIRGVGAVEEIAGGTMIGLKGFRGSEKYTIFFRNDGTVTIGEIPCTKQ